MIWHDDPPPLSPSGIIFVLISLCSGQPPGDHSRTRSIPGKTVEPVRSSGCLALALLLQPIIALADLAVSFSPFRPSGDTLGQAHWGEWSCSSDFLGR